MPVLVINLEAWQLWSVLEEEQTICFYVPFVVSGFTNVSFRNRSSATLTFAAG